MPGKSYTVGGAVQGDIYDDNGNLLLGPSADASTGGIGPALRRYIMSGVYNGDFAVRPSIPDAEISPDNPLPFWVYSDNKGGTLSSALSVADASYPSGYGVRLASGVPDGAVELQLSQTAPINGSRAGIPSLSVQAWVKNVGTGASTAVVAVLDTTFKKVDATTTTGVNASASVQMSVLGIGGSTVLIAYPNGGVVPTDAYYLKIDLQLTASGVDDGSIECSDVRVDSQIAPVPRGCQASRTSTQSVNNTTWTAIPLNATDTFDPFAFHDPASNPSRITIPTGWGGTYLINANASFVANAGLDNRLGIGVGGSVPVAGSYVSQAGIAANATHMQISVVKELAAADYIECYMYQNSGGAINAQDPTIVTVMYLGETV